jgi:hypothetical protein
MFKPLTGLYNEYTAVLHFFSGDPAGADVYSHLTDVDSLLGMTLLLPLLRIMHSFMQLSQHRDVFVHELAQALDQTVAAVRAAYQVAGKRFTADEGFIEYTRLLQVRLLGFACPYKVQVKSAVSVLL